MKKILFITHDTSRTGAPFVLLYFLKWLKSNYPELKLCLLALKGGPLKNEFKEVVDQYFEFPLQNIEPKTFYQEFKIRLRNRLKPHIAFKSNVALYKNITKEDFDLIYANTIISLPVAIDLKKIRPSLKILAHIHELNTVINLNVSNFSQFIDQINFFVVPSFLVKKNLINAYKIPVDKVNVCYEFSKPRALKNNEVNSNFVVGGVGTVHWRKGSDLFIQVAKNIKSNYPDTEISFNWVGACTSREKIIIDSDIEKAGLKGIVNFIDEQKNPEKSFSKFNLLLLTSREDPFPLAAIELGMMGKPIICFKGATGTEEIIQNGGGYIVPYLDIGEMARKIMLYYKDRLELKKDGELAKKLFADFIPDKICPQLFQIVQKRIENK